MIYDVLFSMLCTFFKGLFLNPCTFFKGLLVLLCHFFKGLCKRLRVYTLPFIVKVLTFAP